MTTVRIHHDGPVTVVTIDRPEVRNAVDRATAEALADAFRAFDDDEDRDVAVLTVRAGGPGIAPADQARIFDRFVQLAPERLHHRGFGLGLWIVRQNAAALGGKVTVDSALGAGATFRVELPRP